MPIAQVKMLIMEVVFTVLVIQGLIIGSVGLFKLIRWIRLTPLARLEIDYYRQMRGRIR